MHGPQEASTHGLQRGRATRWIGQGFGRHPCEVVAFCMVRRTTHPHPIGRGRWTPDERILTHTRDGVEAYLKMGQAVGRAS